MKKVALIITLTTIFLAIPEVYPINPQIFYKSVYVYGSTKYLDSIVSILDDIMIIDSNIKAIDEIESKNDLTGADILIYIPDENDIDSREVQLVSEWILSGGKLLMVFAPNSEDNINNLNSFLGSIGSSIRYKYLYNSDLQYHGFKIFGEVSEYNFDPEIYDTVIELKLNSLIYTVRDDFEMGSGGVVFIGDTKSPWILVEYLAVYSDLFTWYYSKIICLSFPVDEISNDQAFRTLFTELLSWGITPYLKPNLYSMGLTLLTGITAVAAYSSIKIYK